MPDALTAVCTPEASAILQLEAQIQSTLNEHHWLPSKDEDTHRRPTM